MDEQTQHAITEAVTRAFSAGVDNGRYIDVSRIPLICQSIVSIDKKLDNLVTQDQFSPVKLLVYGFTAAILLGFISTLLVLAFHVQITL